MVNDETAHLEKDPDAKLDYGFNWADWLNGDTITTSAWTVPAGLTQSAAPPPSNTATGTVIWLEGGTVGTTYDVVNRITTTAGRIEDRTLHIRCTQR